MRRWSGAMLALALAGCGSGGIDAGEVAKARGLIEAARGLTLQTLPASVAIRSAELPTEFDRLLFSPKQVEELKDTARLYAALGLLPENYDLKNALKGLLTREVLAFYVPAESKLVLVSDPVQANPEADKALKERGLPTLRDATIAHELLHALQHQRSGLLGLEGKSSDWDDVRAACRIATEGEAMYYTFDLLKGAAPFDTLWAAAVQDAMKPGPTPLPLLVRRSLYLPYFTGSRIFREQGARALGDRLYAELPVSTEQLLRKDYDLAKDPPLRLAIGDLSSAFGDGWSLELEGVLGVQDLAAQLLADGRTAGGLLDGLDPSLRWGGDRAQLYRLKSAGNTAAVHLVRWDDFSSAWTYARRLRTLRPRALVVQQGASTVLVSGASDERAAEIARRALRQAEAAPFRRAAELDTPLKPRTAPRTDDELHRELVELLGRSTSGPVSVAEMQAFTEAVRGGDALADAVADAFGTLLGSRAVPGVHNGLLMLDTRRKARIGAALFRAAPWMLAGAPPDLVHALPGFLNEADPAAFGPDAVRALQSTGLSVPLRAWLLAYAAGTASRPEVAPAIEKALDDPALAAAFKGLSPHGNLRPVTAAAFEAVQSLLYGALVRRAGAGLSDPLKQLLFSSSVHDDYVPPPELFDFLSLAAIPAPERGHLLARLAESRAARPAIRAYLAGGKAATDLWGRALDALVHRDPGTAVPETVVAAYIDALHADRTTTGPENARTRQQIVGGLPEPLQIRLAEAAAKGNPAALQLATESLQRTPSPSAAFLDACLKAPPQSVLYAQAKKLRLAANPKEAAADVAAHLGRVAGGDLEASLEALQRAMTSDPALLGRTLEALGRALETAPQGFIVGRGGHKRVHHFLRDKRAQAGPLAAKAVELYKKHEANAAAGREAMEACGWVLEAVLDPRTVEFVVQRFERIPRAGSLLTLTCHDLDKTIAQATDTERYTKAFWEKRLPALRAKLPPQLK